MKTSSMTFNETTGDSLITRPQNKLYGDNYEAIFGKKAEKEETRQKIKYAKTEDGEYLFEGEDVAMSYLEALNAYPKTEYIWKEGK